MLTSGRGVDKNFTRQAIEIFKFSRDKALVD